MAVEEKTETPAYDWSPQQLIAIDLVNEWLSQVKAAPKGQHIFRLFGYAGTGKTTLAKYLASGVKGLVCYASLTGKAAQVLRNKGCDAATTIHSLIYTAHRDPVSGTITFSKNYNSKLVEAKLLIVDEVSMVDEALAMDLLSFKVPILVLGDPAQLPPVKGSGYFINAEPDVLLTEVHRQAAENPIIRASMDVRNGKDLQGISIIARKEWRLSDLLELSRDYDQILCGLNRTRIQLNKFIRRRDGRKNDLPEVGDRLVCLRNDHNKGLFNGSLWDVVKVIAINSETIEMDVKSIEEEGMYANVLVRKEFFLGTESGLHWKQFRGTQQFTYGYALTVHKSQGSQWDRVLLFDESFVFQEDSRKHLYTGVTRAAIKLTVVR